MGSGSDTARYRSRPEELILAGERYAEGRGIGQLQLVHGNVEQSNRESVAVQKLDRADVGLNAYDYVPGSAEWPGALVLPPAVEIEGAGNAPQVLRFDVLVLVSGAIDGNQLQLLDYQDLAGPRSIIRAFRDDPSLGFPDVTVRVLRSRVLGYEEQAGYQAFGATFELSAMIG